MRASHKISDAEWKVMQVIWARGSCSAGDIVEELIKDNPDWHPRTIKTFLSRLVRKKVLGFVKDGRAYVYRALVTQTDCVEAASESFLERVFGGSLKPMLAHFVERKKLSAEEISELKRLLEEGKE